MSNSNTSNAKKIWICGPRACGKTTLIKTLLKDMGYNNLYVLGEPLRIPDEVALIDSTLHIIQDKSVVVFQCFRESMFYVGAIMDGVLSNYDSRDITLIFVSQYPLHFPQFMQQKMDQWYIHTTLVLDEKVHDYWMQDMVDRKRKDIKDLHRHTKFGFVKKDIQCKLIY